MTTTSTTTTSSTTTVTETTTATTTTVVLTPADYRAAALQVWDESMRQGVIEALSSDDSVQSVDLVTLDTDTDTVVLDVTSTWASFDRQEDAAWEITRAFAAFWEATEFPVLRHPGWAANFRLVNSGTTYACAADFMIRLADVMASRSDFQAECATTIAPAPAPTAPPTTQDEARIQLEADIAIQRATVAALERSAASARTTAETEAPSLQARIDHATQLGAVKGAAALQRELDRLWNQANQLEGELAAARTALVNLEARL